MVIEFALYWNQNIDVFDNNDNMKKLSYYISYDVCCFVFHRITRATFTPKYPGLPWSIFMQHVVTVKQSGPWNSLGIWAHTEDGDRETVRLMEQSRYTSFSGGYVFPVGWNLKICQIWPWRSRSIASQNNRDLNQGLCIFGLNLVILAGTGPELSRGQASDWHRQTDRQTDRYTSRRLFPWRRLGLSLWQPGGGRWLCEDAVTAFTLQWR